MVLLHSSLGNKSETPSERKERKKERTKERKRLVGYQQSLLSLCIPSREVKRRESRKNGGGDGFYTEMYCPGNFLASVFMGRGVVKRTT